MASHSPIATHGAKAVRLKARPNLEIAPRQVEGRRLFLVRDLVSLRYFHLEEAQQFILGQMDGRRTLEDIRQAYEKEFPPQRLSVEEIQAFANQLLNLGLVQDDTAAAGSLVQQRRQKQESQERWGRLQNLFYWKIPLVNAGPWLDHLRWPGALLFNPFTVFLVSCLLGGAGSLVVTHWSTFVDRLSSIDYFGWEAALYFWLALGLVKIFHELGHALCCKRLGAEVNEFGIAFFFFFPTLYCNVSDSWVLPEKSKRMAIAAAGIYIELILAAVCIFLWWVAAPGSFLQSFCLSLVLVCTVHTLVFNANPLMRSDGYFLLSDWLEIPNLAQVAQARLQEGLTRWFGFATETSSPRGNLLLPLYALACLIYRVIVVVGILWVCHEFAQRQRLAWVGQALILAALVALLLGPLFSVGTFLYRHGGRIELKPWKAGVTAGSILLLLAAVFVIPWPQHVRGKALIQVDPEFQQVLNVPASGGFLQQILVRDGQHVNQDQVLAVFRNPELETKLLLNEAEQALRREQQRSLTVHLASLNLVTSHSESYQEMENTLKELAQHHLLLKTQAQRLILRAPRAGTVLGLPSWDVQGKWLEGGQPFVRVGDTQKVRALLVVRPADRQLITPGHPAVFRSPLGIHRLQGHVSGVAQVDAETIPAPLTTTLGGDVATRTDSHDRQEKPLQQHYVVTLQFPGGNSSPHIGTLGQVSIDAGSATLWKKIQQFVYERFRTGS